MNVVVRPAAATDIEYAIHWYTKKREALGVEFLQALRDAMERIVENPEAHRVLHRGTRRARLRRFPYGLYFRLYPDVVVVVACMHGRRDPIRWQLRK